MRAKHIVWIAQNVISQITIEAKRVDPNETGGVLLGYWAREDEAVILTASGPGTDAIHAPRRFIPDAQYQESWIADRYAASNGIEGYLGDWHTHPNAMVPRLSFKDRSTAKRISNYADARAPTPLVMIIAGAGENWRTAAWQRTPKNLFNFFTRAEFVECEVRSFKNQQV